MFTNTEFIEYMKMIQMILLKSTKKLLLCLVDYWIFCAGTEAVPARDINQGDCVILFDQSNVCTTQPYVMARFAG